MARSRRHDRRELLLAGIAAATASLLLSWHHVLRGGWRLRNVFEAPAARDRRLHAEHRRSRLDSFAEERPHILPGSIVFIGSSTVEHWPLEATFPERPCVNRGIGAETAREILERLDCSLAPGVAGIVLYTGSRDHREGGLTTAETLKDATALLREIRKRLPEVALTLVGVLPGRDLSVEEVERLRKLNGDLERAASSVAAAFLPVDRAPLTLESGSLDSRLSRDRWHLNEEGYSILSQWLIEGGGAVGALLSPERPPGG